MWAHPRLTLLLLFLFLLAAAPAAGDEDDHDRARAALQRGEIVSLREILAEIDRQGLGSVLEVELERHDGRWVYEVETLSATGVIAKVWIDGKDKRVLRQVSAADEDD